MSFPGTFITAITKVASAVISLIYDFLWSDRTSYDYDIEDQNDMNLTTDLSNIYGVAFSRDGNTMAVSASSQLPNLFNSSAQKGIVIFELISDQWQPQAYLEPYPTWSYGTASSNWTTNFGQSLCFSGDGNTLVVSDLGYQDNGGAAYVFEKGSGWTDGDSNLSARLQPSGLSVGDYFCTGVKTNYDGTVITAGAGGVSVVNTDTGKLFVFEKGAGWSNGNGSVSAQLTVSGSGNGWNIGSLNDISDDGNTIVTTACLKDADVYIFEKGSGWSTTSTPTYTLDISNIGLNGVYAISMSGDGEYIAISMGNHRPINEAGDALFYPNNSSIAGMMAIYKKGSGWVTGSSNYLTALFSSESVHGNVDNSYEAGIMSKSGNTIVVDFRYNYDVNDYDGGVLVFQKQPDEEWQHGYANVSGVIGTTAPTGNNRAAIATRGSATDMNNDWGSAMQNLLHIAGDASMISGEGNGNASGLWPIWKGTDPDA